MLSVEPCSPPEFDVCSEEPINYDRDYQHISKYVKSLRHRKIKPSELQLKQLSKFALATVSFLQTKDANKSSLFLQALITLDNSLNISGQILKSIIFSKAFFNNVNRYFLDICGDNEQQITESESEEKIMTSFQKIIQFEKSPKNLKEKKGAQKNFELYSVFYLVVMLIYETNRREDHTLLMKHLLNNRFLTQLFSLELTHTNKMAKLVGIIITFLVKTLNMTSEGKNLKRFILNNLYLTGSDPRIEFYFFYALRTVKDSITLSDIRKFNLIGFLSACLQKHSATHNAVYIYDLLQLLLRKYPILGYQLLNQGFIRCLEKDVFTHKNQILNIFESLSPCISENTRQRSIGLHLVRIRQADNRDKNLSLLMVMTLFQDTLDSGFCLQIVKSEVLQLALARLADYPSSSQDKLIRKFVLSFMDKIEQVNQSIASLLYYRLLDHKDNLPQTLRNQEMLSKLQQKFSPIQETSTNSFGRCFSIL